MRHVFNQSNISMGCHFHQTVISLHAIILMGVKFIPGIYHINHTVMKNMNGSGFQRKYIWMGMVFKNIKYMNGGCFENLSGTFVPKNIGRHTHPWAAKQTIPTWFYQYVHYMNCNTYEFLTKVQNRDAYIMFPLKFSNVSTSQSHALKWNPSMKISRLGLNSNVHEIFQ